jgi:translocator protein
MKNKEWYKNLKKSSLSPPDYVFGIVWPILYTLMFISLIILWTNKKCYPYCEPITYFMFQLFFNITWTNLFFNLKKPFWALVDLCVTLLFTVITYKKMMKFSKTAAYLLVPYILWLSFAFYLNIYIVYYQ